MTAFVESSEYLRKKHQADICALISSHDFFLHHSIVDEQLKLLIDCVRKVVWTKIIAFLDGLFCSFMAICENRPHKAFRGHVARVTVEVAKYFHFPHGLYLNPFKYAELLPQFEEDLVPLCKCLFDQFTPPHVHLAPLRLWIPFN